MYLTLKFKGKIVITGHLEVKNETVMITKNYFHVISVLC